MVPSPLSTPLERLFICIRVSFAALAQRVRVTRRTQQRRQRWLGSLPQNIMETHRLMRKTQYYLSGGVRFTVAVVRWRRITSEQAQQQAVSVPRINPFLLYGSTHPCRLLQAVQASHLLIKALSIQLAHGTSTYYAVPQSNHVCSFTLSGSSMTAACLRYQSSLHPASLLHLPTSSAVPPPNHPHAIPSLQPVIAKASCRPRRLTVPRLLSPQAAPRPLRPRLHCPSRLPPSPARHPTLAITPATAKPRQCQCRCFVATQGEGR